MTLQGQSQKPAAEELIARTVMLSGHGDDDSPVAVEGIFLAPRTLPHLSRRQSDGASRASAAYAAAPCLIVLLPIGHYDDGVWAPIIETLIKAAPPARRETILAWCGIEPFLAPFDDGCDLWRDPRLAPILLSVFERRARSLSAIIRSCQMREGSAPLRRGLARFVQSKTGEPDGVSLALA